MLSDGREFQTEGTAGMKALSQDCGWYIPETEKGPMWLEQNG